nr:MAG TPA: hypothetical protein [Caudoviricetes sp.]
MFGDNIITQKRLFGKKKEVRGWEMRKIKL